MGSGFDRRWATALGAVTIALVAMALAAVGAAAATPIELGTANFTDGTPGLALGSTGAAVLSFASFGQLHFCQVAPGGTGCAESLAVPEPPTFTEDVGNWPLVSGKENAVVDARDNGGSYENKYLYFGAPINTHMTTLGTTNSPYGGTLGFTEALYVPKGTLTPEGTVVTIGGGPDISGAPLAASETLLGTGNGTKFFVSNAGATEVSTSDAAIAMQGSLLSSAYVTDFGSEVLWRRYLGGLGTPEKIETNADWSAPSFVGLAAAGSPVRLAGGPHGLYLAYERAGDGAVVLQQYDGGNGFEAPVVITPAEVSSFDISEDSAGIVHVAYSTPSIDEALHYSYAKSALNTEFTRPQNVTNGEFRGIRLVTDGAGNGWISWKDDATTNHDWVIAVAPGEGPGPAAPPSASGGGGSTGGGAAPTHPVSPTATTPLTKATSVPLGHGLVGQLSVPGQCVAGGGGFKAQLRVKRKGSQAHKVSYTVKKVKFSLAGKPISVDTSKPFEADFTTKGAGAGKSLAVAAGVTVALHLGHRTSKVTKTLTAKVRTCG